MTFLSLPRSAWRFTLFTAGILVTSSCGEPTSPSTTTPTSTSTAPSEPIPAPAEHWAFSVRSNAEPPEVEEADWVKNPIDAFVLSKLEAAGRSHAPLASPDKLLRRVSLVLTGLPPTAEELDAFEEDPSDAAYAAKVDTLLASPRFGEHLAVNWLDMARYSDTDGFQYDTNRPAWPWRDWVIDAFNSNLPYDQFITHQLAGDMVQNANTNTVLATAFNRNHAIQGENGLLLNSFRDRYVTDRVETVSRAWIGLTFGCAKCHNHKFEPISAVDFYRIYDCFNQTDEGDNGPASEFRPTAAVLSPLSQTFKTELEARIRELSASGAPAQQIAELEAERTKVSELPVRVMSDQPVRRTTQVLAGGHYAAPFGDAITCSAPSALPPFKPEFANNRLGLAQWLTMPENPLTARVVVNRFWAHVFGAGLVPSLDNFGVQTAKPAQADLLDWLATSFIESGWDVKALFRLMVTSNTFQQATETTAGELEVDEPNQYLARGPRFRLGAEAIRDAALHASGLLVELQGGPPAYPYQPPGLWEELSWEYNQLTYPVKSGDSLYRRSIYSFWKKTLPPPLFSLFDAPEREVSCAYRETSITPLQSLALLNDPQFIQAASALATRVIAEAGEDQQAALGAAFRWLTSRRPTAEEAQVLAEAYDVQLQAHQSLAPSATPDQGRLAATTEVIRIILNLSETITVE
jgi:hypothetical protein